ncbi:MAG TPA: MFS transporter [Gemmataceae bacterium]|nr:MFS transporter [Gemmataceae bacterium]
MSVSTEKKVLLANDANDKRLFWGCFTALVATAFAFVARTMVIDEWGVQFGLNQTEKGEILGVGLWPVAISIVLFSLVIDRIGYSRAVIFAFCCHAVSTVLILCTPLVATGTAGSANAYKMLYWGTFLVALSNGTVEAFINPVVATMFSREKTKWLNILHAGWPGGMLVGGVIIILLGAAVGWQYKIGLIFLPTLLYAILIFGCRFPVNERVAAGISYREMLKEAGIVCAMIAGALIVRELGRVFKWNVWIQVAIFAIALGAYSAYVRSLGRPMFIFLVIVMIPLAITELGTDSWVTPLMESEMTRMGLAAGWLLVYTSLIMTVLRFLAGPIVHALSPLGLLAVSAALAALGLVSLSAATGIVILAAATLYGLGKTFFWPTMLGVVSEQFPKGGALTLNMISGIGMLGVGIVGAALLGNIQDKEITRVMQEKYPALLAKVEGKESLSVFGKYQALDEKKVEAATPEEQNIIKNIQNDAKKNALFTTAIFPCFMFVSYLILILYFRAKGGYKAQVLIGHAAEDREFTGGVEAGMEA